MPRYRIHYLKESQREHFRHAAPSPSPLRLKLKDYQPGESIEAPTPYAAWKKMRDEGSGRPIDVGDALESEAGALVVCRYVGFEDAQWFVPEPPPPPEAAAPSEGPAPVLDGPPMKDSNPTAPETGGAFR